MRRTPVKDAVWDLSRTDLLIALKKPDGTIQLLAKPPHDGTLPLILENDLTEPGRGFFWDVPVIWDEIPTMRDADGELLLDACIVGRVGHGGTLVWDRPPGTLDLDGFGLWSGAVSYVRTPVNFRVEAGRTYHITWRNGFKFEVREEP